MLVKQNRIRLSGKKVSALNDYIHERDNHCCINCGKYVNPGEKAHHEPCGRHKEDVPEKMCLLCFDCHQKRESKYGEPIKQKCIEHLDKHYPDRRDRYVIPA